MANRTLSLKEMFQLYDLVGKYMPKEEIKEDTVLQFIGKIVDNLIEAGKHSNYVDAILLMKHKRLEDIKDLPTKEIIGLFVEGLAENDIFAFRQFLNEVNFNV